MAQYPSDLTEDDIFQAIINPNGAYDINPEDYALPEDAEDTEYVLPEERTAPTEKPRSAPKSLGGKPSAYDEMIYRKAVAAGQDPNLVKAQLWAESSFNPKAVSNKGAQGMAQFMPGTWAKYGKGSPFDPEAAVDAQLAYNADLIKRFGGDERKVIAAYNWGEHRKAYNLPDWERRAPGETRDYVNKILAKRDEYAGGPQTPYAPQSAPEMYDIDLPNGGKLSVPGHVSREDALAEAKANGIDIGSAGAMRELTLPNGGVLQVPEGVSDEDALAEARANIPELADMTAPQPEGGKEHNVFKELAGNVLGGGKEALAGLYEGIGRFSSDPSWREDAKQFRAEAEKMRTEIPQEEVDAAYKQGFGSGVLKEFQQKGLYPAADMVGRYGHLFIPSSPIIKVAQFGLESVASMGDTLHRAEQEGKEISDFNAVASGMVSSALATMGLPHTLSSGLVGKVLGGASGKTIENVFKKEGAEAAEKLIGSRLADVARGAVESTAAGFGVMAGTDAAQRAAIGMDQMSPEDLKSTLENAAWFSFMGLPSSLGAKGRRAEHLGYLKEQEALKQKDAELRGERPPEGQEEAPPAPSQMPDEEFPDLTKAQADLLREAEKKAADRAATQEVSDEETAPPVTEDIQETAPPVTESTAPPVPPSDIAPPATETVAPEISEPVVRGQAEVSPEPPPAHFSDALGIERITGRKIKLPLKRALEQLDINNPEHHATIAKALREGITLAEKGEIQLDIPKAQELLSSLKPPEVQQPTVSAIMPSKSEEQKPYATQSQPNVIQEGAQTKPGGTSENRSVSQETHSRGVENLTQRLQDAARVYTEKGRNEAAKLLRESLPRKAGQHNILEYFDRNREALRASGDYGAIARETITALGTRTSQGRKWLEQLTGKLGVAEQQRTPEGTRESISKQMVEESRPVQEMSEHGAKALSERNVFPVLPTGKSEQTKARNISGAEGALQSVPEVQEVKTPEVKIPEAPKAPIEQKVPSAPVAPGKPKRVSAEKEAKEAISQQDALAKRITAYVGTLKELHGQIKAEEAKNPNSNLLTQLKDRRERATLGLETARRQQSQMLQAEEAKRIQDAEVQAAGARAEAARKVKEQGGYELDLLEAEQKGKQLEKEPAARQTVPTLPVKPVKGKLREVSEADGADAIIKRLEEMEAKKAEAKKAEKLPAKGEAGVANPHTRESIQAELNKLYGKNAPKIEISDRATEEVDAATKGFHEPSTGRTVLIADNIGKGEDLHGLVRHEVAVHAKKLGKTDKEFQSILKRVDDLRAQGAKDVVEAFARVPEGTKPEDVTHEALAYLSQHKPKLPVVRAFKSWVRRTVHKLTGSADWLKGDDFAVMADNILRKAEKTPSKEPAHAEGRLYAKEKPEVKEHKLRDLTTITPSGPIAKLNNVKDAVSEVLTGVTSGKFRQAAIAQSESLAKHLSKLETYSDYFGIRADLLRNQYDGISHLFSHALNMGTPDISEGNMMKINKNSRLALGKWLKDSDKLEVDQKTAFGVLRALIGEARAKETGDIQRKIDTLTDYANRMKKAADGAEGRDRDKYRNKAAEARAKVRELSKKGDIDLGGLEKLVSAENIAEAHTLLKDNPKLADWVKRTHEINRAAVDFQYKTGVLDKATAADWKARPYIPLFKSLEQLAKEDGRSLQIMGGSAKSLGGRKRAKGGTQIVNVPENMLRSWVQMYTTGYTNHVRKVSVDQLRLFGGAEKTGPSDKMAVKVREGGKDTYWRVADKNLLSALEMSPFARNTFMDIVSAPSSLLRAGAIKTPLFWIKSLTREPLTANFTSRTGFVSPVKVAGEVLKTLAGYNKGVDPLHQRGITGYYSSDVSPEAFTKALTKTSTAKKLGDFWNHIHTSFDTATRTAVQEEARKQGRKLGLRGEKLEDFAALRASEFANFATKGSSQLIHEFGRMTPFFNASLNSLDNLARSATGRNLNAREKAEARSLFRARAVGMAHFTMLYTLAQLNNPAYRNAANNEWLDNWMFDPSEEPGGMTRWLKVAAGFEAAFLFKTIPEALTRMYMGALTPKEATVSLFEKGKEKMLPPMVPLLPALLFEGQTGVNLVTGRATESLGMQKLPVEMRDKGASEIAKKIVEDYGLGKMGVSPVVLDTMGKGLAADIYSMATMMADLYLASNEGLSLYDKDMTQKYPVAKAIYTNPQNIQQTPTYFEGEAAAQQAVTGINKAANRGDVKAFERLMNDPELIADYKLSGPLRKIRENIQAIDSSIAYIENMKVPEKEKERLFAEQIRLKHLYIKQGAEAIEESKRSPD